MKPIKMKKPILEYLHDLANVVTILGPEHVFGLYGAPDDSIAVEIEYSAERHATLSPEDFVAMARRGWLPRTKFARGGVLRHAPVHSEEE